MFTKSIYSTAFTNDTADRLFANIADCAAPDKSYISTLRALLRKRLPDGESVKVICKPLHYNAVELASISAVQAMNLFMAHAIRSPNRYQTEHVITIVHTVNPDAGAKMLEIVRANAGVGKHHMSDYTAKEDLRVFYARKLNALFYVSGNGRNTVIFTDKLDLKQFHALQMTTPKYLPELFKDSPLTESETALLKSLGNRSSTEFEAILNDFAKDLDFRSEIIRTKLAGFETAYERIRIDELNDEIADYEREYNDYLTFQKNIMIKIQERKYTLAGLKCAVTEVSGDSELMEYFMCNKNLSIIKVTGTAIEFVAHGYIDIYDNEAFSRYVGNHNGYMYSNLNYSITKAQMEKLYRAIFEKRQYKLRVCGAFTADVRTGLRGLQHYIFPTESLEYFPNPHIQQYGCIGSYAGRFQEYMKNRDYVGAIDQAVVSARNLNFYDSTVISTFSETLSYSQIRCIENAEGSVFTPIEAINELEKDCL